MTLNTAANKSYFDFNEDVPCIIKLAKIEKAKTALYNKKIARGLASTETIKDYNALCDSFVAQVRIVWEYRNQQ